MISEAFFDSIIPIDLNTYEYIMIPNFCFEIAICLYTNIILGITRYTQLCS